MHRLFLASLAALCGCCGDAGIDLDAHRLIAGPAADLDRIAIEVVGGNPRTVLERRSGVWRLTEPIADRAEPAMIAALAGALEEPGLPLKTEPARSSPFGRLRVVLRTTAGRRTRTIRFGNRREDWSLAEADDGTRFRVPESLVKTLQGSFLAYRDHRLHPLDPTEVSILRFEPADGSPVLTIRRTPAGWLLLGSTPGRLAATQIASLRRLLGARLRGIGNRQAGLAKLLEMEPFGALRLTAGASSYTIQLYGDGVPVFGHAVGRPFLLEVDPSSLLLLTEKGDLRAARLFQTPLDDLNSIEWLPASGSSWQHERVDPEWVRKGGAFLAAARDARVLGRRQPAASLESLGRLELSRGAGGGPGDRILLRLHRDPTDGALLVGFPWERLLLQVEEPFLDAVRRLEG